MAPPKKANKLLNLVNTEETQKIIKPKTSLQSLQKELLRDTKFAEYNSLMMGTEIPSIEVISSGILRLDYEIGIGGFPRGKTVQLYGKESSWKSTICLKTIAEAQKAGGDAIWFDAEYSYDSIWAKRHGVDASKILIIRPDTLEDMLNTMEKVCKRGTDVIVLDSLAALAPHKEMYTNESKKERQPLDKEGMALAARMWSKWSRQGPKFISQNNNLFMIVNQIRSSLSPYGSPTSVPGGNAVKHLNSLTLNTKRITAKDGQIIDKKTGKVIGGKYEFTIDKTRYGVIGNSGSFEVTGTTIDNILVLRDLSIREGIIERVSNSSYLIGENKITGADKVAEYIRENQDIAASLEKELRFRMINNYIENADTFAAQAQDPEEVDWDAVESEIPEEEEIEE